AGWTSAMSTSWVTGPCWSAAAVTWRGVCVMVIGAGGGGGGGGGAAPPGTTTRTEATIQGCGVQWYPKAPGWSNLNENVLPGAISGEWKSPSFDVTVCLFVPLLRHKTVVPVVTMGSLG